MRAIKIVLIKNINGMANQFYNYNGHETKLHEK